VNYTTLRIYIYINKAHRTVQQQPAAGEREAKYSREELADMKSGSCRHVFLVVSLQLLLVAPWQGETAAAARALNFTRQDFPRAFVFGAGTSAYQVGISTHMAKAFIRPCFGFSN